MFPRGMQSRTLYQNALFSITLSAHSLLTALKSVQKPLWIQKHNITSTHTTRIVHFEVPYGNPSKWHGVVHFESLRRQTFRPFHYSRSGFLSLIESGGFGALRQGVSCDKNHHGRRGRCLSDAAFKCRRRAAFQGRHGDYLNHRPGAHSCGESHSEVETAQCVDKPCATDFNSTDGESRTGLQCSRQHAEPNYKVVKNEEKLFGKRPKCTQQNNSIKHLATSALTNVLYHR